MKNIIQLSNYEYEQINEKANLNEKEINEKAIELYKEKGVCAIRLTLDTKERDYDDEITIYAKSYIEDWNKNFEIADNDKRNIVKFVNERALKMMQRKYGKQIANIEFYNKEGRNLTRLKYQFILFTIIGWLLAIITTLSILLK